MSCVPEVGALLRTLAAAVRPGGRILEMGTGAGVGLAWLAAGIEGRDDVSLTSVEVDAGRAALAQGVGWPAGVTIEVGDSVEVMRAGRYWNLIFADSPAGKWYALDDTIESLADGGLVVFDDMVPPDYLPESDRGRFREIRESILGDPRLVSVELDFGSGVILGSRAVRS